MGVLLNEHLVAGAAVGPQVHWVSTVQGAGGCVSPLGFGIVGLVEVKRQKQTKQQTKQREQNGKQSIGMESCKFGGRAK